MAQAASPWTPVDESASAWTPVEEEGTQAAAPSFFERHPLLREATLGAFSGAGIPETQQPVTDLASGMAGAFSQPTAQSPMDERVAGVLGPIGVGAYRMGKGLVKGTYEAGGDVGGGLYRGAIQGDPAGYEQAAHGAGQLAGTYATVGLGNKTKVDQIAPDIIPARQRGGQGLGMMDKAYADLPIKPTRSYGAATELVRKIQDYGNINVPPALQKFIDRVSAADIAERHPEVAQELRQQGVAVDQPLTFPDARGHRTALNDLKYDSSLPDKIRAQIGHVAGELDADIKASAPHDAFLKDYTRFNKEYARASKVGRFADAVGPLLGGTAGAAIGGEAGGMFGMDVGARLGTAAGRMMGKPVIGGMADSVLDRSVPAPKLTPPSPPYNAPSSSYPKTREAYTRIMMDAKEGKINPTRADQMLRNSPRMRRMPQPPEEP